MNSTESIKTLKKYLSENIPDLDALLVVDKGGNIVEKEVSSQFKIDHDDSWLTFFGMKVSARFSMSEFHKQLGGLRMTVNVFKEKAAIVKMLETNHFLIVIVPWKTTSVFNAMNLLYENKT